MLHYDRTDEPAPACLSDERTARARDILREAFARDAVIAAQTRIDTSELLLEDPELQAALERLFRGKCAFCERPAKTQAYRFRPSEEAGPTSDAPEAFADRAHLYYSWLANSWENIYPVCADCRPLEPTVFPVRGKRCPLPERHEIENYADRPTGLWRGKMREAPLLLDPCGKDDLRSHLQALPGGQLIGLTERGRFTIRHFNLDRDNLQYGRHDALQTYFERLTRDEPEDMSWLFAFADMAHGGSWYLLLCQLVKAVGSQAGARPALSKTRIEAFFRDGLRRADFHDAITQAFTDISARDEALLVQDKVSRPLSNSAPYPIAFHIRDFKSLEDLEVCLPMPAVAPEEGEPSGAALMILGENSAGKSSILEAITLALTSKAARAELSENVGRFMLNPVYLGGSGAPRRGSIETRFEDGSAEALGVQPGWPVRIGSRAPEGQLPLFAYGAFRMFLSGDRRGGVTGPIRSLFEPSYVLPNPEDWLAKIYDTPAFSEVARALRSILAIDQPFDVIERNQNGEFCLSVLSPGGGRAPIKIQTPFKVVSSGFRSVLGMACAVMRGLLDQQGSRSATLARARAVILIDEIEAHLHPRWKMRIMTGLRQALPNVIFIVTTHDPLCLRGMATHEVMAVRRMRRPDAEGEQCAEMVEVLAEIPPIDALTVEQLLTSDLFQLFSTDAAGIEDSFAQAADLLSLDAADMTAQSAEKLKDMRSKLREQVRRSMPVGSTQVERLIQEAVETYLKHRRISTAQQLIALEADTRASIVAALEQL